MSTLVTASTPDTPSSSGRNRFKWFVRLCIGAIALVGIPTIAFQGPSLISKGISNPYSGAYAFIYLPLSFAVWQAALVLLYLSGRDTVGRQLKNAAALVASYVVAASVAIALFWLFPARFY
jgi:hypothetical protein